MPTEEEGIMLGDSVQDLVRICAGPLPPKNKDRKFWRIYVFWGAASGAFELAKRGIWNLLATAYVVS